MGRKKRPREGDAGGDWLDGTASEVRGSLDVGCTGEEAVCWARAVCLDACAKPLVTCPAGLGWLRLGVNALDSSSCAKLSWASRDVCSAVRETTAARVVLGLGQGCIKHDLASNRLANPMLALSHLESLANAPFMFESLRGLLRFLEFGKDGSSAILLEAPQSSQQLCELLCEQVFEASEGQDGLDDDSKQLRASTVARVASLMYQYLPPADSMLVLESCLSHILGWVGPNGKGKHPKVDAASIIERGGAAARLVHALPNLLPSTRTFKDLASKRKKVWAARLVCQLLERLVFPSSEASLILQLSFPVGRAENRQILQGQTASFVQSMQVLQSEVWTKGKTLDVLAVQAKRCYLLVFESLARQEHSQAMA